MNSQQERTCDSVVVADSFLSPTLSFRSEIPSFLRCSSLSPDTRSEKEDDWTHTPHQKCEGQRDETMSRVKPSCLLSVFVVCFPLLSLFEDAERVIFSSFQPCLSVPGQEEKEENGDLRGRNSSLSFSFIVHSFLSLFCERKRKEILWTQIPSSPSSFYLVSKLELEEKKHSERLQRRILNTQKGRGRVLREWNEMRG